MLKIIIAEDHAMHADVLAMSLKHAFECETITTVIDGLALLEKWEEIQPDLIILDISLPRLNGFKATEKIRETDRNVKILACSMYQDRDTIHKILELGANGYFHKSSNFAKFVNAISDVMKGVRYVDDKVFDIFLGIEKAKIDNKQLENSQPNEDGLFPQFSQREIRILKLFSEGLSQIEIGETLNISPDTVAYHRNNMLKKSGCKNVAQLIRWASVNHII